jgi:hypothetical protein
VNSNTDTDADTDTEEDKSDKSGKADAGDESDIPSENSLSVKVDTTTTLAWCISQYKAPKAETVKGKPKWKWQCHWCRYVSYITIYVIYITDVTCSKFRHTDRSVDIIDYPKETINLKSTSNFMTHHTTECKLRPASNTLT